ncbi:MAG: methyltransferase domain-containing protein [Cocleimonas sp.]|nr:methyltransferase domain-containing protein [Cocleimonas sp.]
MTNSSTIEWEQFYQSGKTGWDRGDISPNLNYWLENQQLQPCRILIPGCGNGYEVLHLAAKGFDVVAIDIAPTAVDNLNNALADHKLNAEVILADFFKWNPEKPFDALYEQTSLCALSPERWQAYEQCLFSWLKPNGKLLAQFMQTDVEGGPPYHCEMGDMTDLFDAARWQWSDEHHTKIVHSGGKSERVYRLTRV